MTAWRWRGLLVGTLAAGLTAAGLVGVASAGEHAPAPKGDGASVNVIGGNPAPQPYSFMASLQFQGQKYCAGALVAPTLVVTAAHCGQAEKVRIGSLTWQDGGELIDVVELIEHPDWNGGGNWRGHDIALLRLAVPSTLPPAVLASQVIPGQAVRLMGWGRTCEDDTPECRESTENRHLQQIDTMLADPATCTILAPWHIDPLREWCVSNRDGSKQACKGDSGAPLVIEYGGAWQIIGVTSRDGDTDPKCGTGPGIWSNVLHHRDWITNVISG
jgi:secreted trypsin-like serine protease